MQLNYGLQIFYALQFYIQTLPHLQTTISLEKILYLCVLRSNLNQLNMILSAI